MNTDVITIDLGYVNSFLLKGEEVVLVDCGNPGDSDKILQKMDEHGIDSDEISLVLITHGHIDHYGGASKIIEEIDTELAVHEKDVEALIEGKNMPIKPVGIKGRLLKLFLSENRIGSLEPDLTFDRLDLREYGVDGKVIPTPGHTPGSVSIILNSREVIIGDLLMGGLIRDRSPGLPAFAVDIDEIKESLGKIMKFKPKRIYASHGGPFFPKSVRRFASPR